MTITPDDDFAAAEDALGTLDASERARLAARRLREPELDEAIRGWEAAIGAARRGGAGGRAAARPAPRDRSAHRGARPKRGGMRRLSRSDAASRAGAPRRWQHPSSPPCWRSDFARETRQAVRSARVCGDPAEGRGFARLRGDGQSRQAGNGRFAPWRRELRRASHTNCGSSTRSSARRARSA